MRHTAWVLLALSGVACKTLSASAQTDAEVDLHEIIVLDEATGPQPKQSSASHDTSDASSSSGGVRVEARGAVREQDEQDWASIAGRATPSFALRGWARTRASQAVLGDSASGPNGSRVPFDPWLLEEQLFLEVRYARNAFECAASGLLWYSLSRRETVALDGDQKAALEPSFAPSLRELYVGAFSPKLSARIGQQRIAWGNSDAFPINDVINPRDLRDPILAESDVFHIPTMAARLGASLNVAHLELIAIPFFVPDRMDFYGTNWALVQPDAPLALRTAYAYLRPPPANLARDPGLSGHIPTDSALGARLDWSAYGVDLSHYYHYGYTSFPALRVSDALIGQLATTRLERATPEQLAVLRTELAAGLTAAYERRHHVGTSWQTTAGAFLLRGEVAYQSRQVFRSEALLSVIRPVVQGVFGAEYQPGDDGKLILLEASYQRILGADTPPLLGTSRDSYALAMVARWRFFEHLDVGLRVIGTLRPHGIMVRPELGYKRDSLEIKGGVLLMAGDSLSQYQYFRRNSNAYVIIKTYF